MWKGFSFRYSLRNVILYGIMINFVKSLTKPFVGLFIDAIERQVFLPMPAHNANTFPTYK